MSGSHSSTLPPSPTSKWDQPVSYQQSQQAARTAALSNNEYLRQSCSAMKIGIGPRLYSECPHAVTFQQYSPGDRVCLENAINAAYRQVYGNAHFTDHERSVELEAKLSNGEINVREFVQGLAKSPFYKARFFESVAPQRGIELNFKHLLGRAPLTQAELIEHITLLASSGYEALIDNIVNSPEYQEIFGENTVPYLRYLNSTAGVRQSNFNRTATMQNGFAISDNTVGVRSKTLMSLANGQSQPLKIKRQSINQTTGMTSDGERSTASYIGGIIILLLSLYVFTSVIPSWVSSLG